MRSNYSSATGARGMYAFPDKTAFEYAGNDKVNVGPIERLHLIHFDTHRV